MIGVISISLNFPDENKISSGVMIGLLHNDGIIPFLMSRYFSFRFVLSNFGIEQMLTHRRRFQLCVMFKILANEISYSNLRCYLLPLPQLVLFRAWEHFIPWIMFFILFIILFFFRIWSFISLSRAETRPIIKFSNVDIKPLRMVYQPSLQRWNKHYAVLTFMVRHWL